jgi:hypothetical protein
MVVLMKVLFAILETLIFAGPLVVLLWYSWQGVLTATLILASLGAFFFSAVVAVGRSETLLATIALLLLAVGLAAGAIYMARQNFPRGLAATILGLMAIMWLEAGHQHVTNAWDAGVLNPPKRSSEARDEAAVDEFATDAGANRLAGDVLETAQATGDSGTAPEARPDSVFVLRDVKGELHRVTMASTRDFVILGDGPIHEKAFLKLITDPQMAPWLEGRHMYLLVHRFRGGASERIARLPPMQFVGLYNHQPRRTPGFYDASTGTFSTDVYRWMRDVLEIPLPQRDELYLRHHDILPD